MIENEIQRLTAFMNGSDRPTYARMITFFSVQGKYLHPREIENFRNSMTDEEWVDFKVDFWEHVVSVGETEYEDAKLIRGVKEKILDRFAA